MKNLNDKINAKRILSNVYGGCATSILKKGSIISGIKIDYIDDFEIVFSLKSGKLKYSLYHKI